MASPTSSVINSVASTPSITITDDHGRGEVLKLPDASVGPERPRSITCKAPAPAPALASESKDANLGGVGKTAESCIKSVEGKKSSGALQSAPTSDPSATSTAKKERPTPKRSGSGIFTDLKHQVSSSTLFHHKTNGPKANGTKSVATSGTASPRTPEVQALFSKDVHGDRSCPNLDAVNRALESLRASTPEGSGPDAYISHLSALAEQIQRCRTDSKKALTHAMKARDQGQHEVCRALCLSIVQNKHAERETQVYAYNILSTQASPGQAMNYLSEAFKLAKESEARGVDCEKMLDVIAVLREGALARDGVPGAKARETTFREAVGANGAAVKANSKLDLDTGELDKKLDSLTEISELRRGSLSPKDLLAVPRGDLPSGMLTPKTEKIFKWAAKQQA